jgi:hypothetical protein
MYNMEIYIVRVCIVLKTRIGRDAADLVNANNELKTAK